MRHTLQHMITLQDTELVEELVHIQVTLIKVLSTNRLFAKYKHS